MWLHAIKWFVKPLVPLVVPTPGWKICNEIRRRLQLHRGSLPAAVHQQFSLQRGKDCHYAHPDVCRHLLLEVPWREHFYRQQEALGLVGHLGKSSMWEPLLPLRWDGIAVCPTTSGVYGSLERILRALTQIHMNWNNYVILCHQKCLSIRLEELGSPWCRTKFWACDKRPTMYQDGDQKYSIVYSELVA